MAHHLVVGRRRQRSGVDHHDLAGHRRHVDCLRRRRADRGLAAGRGHPAFPPISGGYYAAATGAYDVRAECATTVAADGAVGRAPCVLSTGGTFQVAQDMISTISELRRRPLPARGAAVFTQVEGDHFSVLMPFGVA